MYLSIAVFFFVLLLCSFTLFTRRRRRCVQKVCALSHTEKCGLLCSLLSPFGYLYDASQDLITTKNDAWQRSLGYTALFDRAAVSFHMVFDCLPVYFDYAGRTWLIEFWKGQYGLSTGAEVGVYYTDRILSEEEYPRARFQAVSDPNMLPLAFELTGRASRYARLSRRTWWLTSFSPGCFTDPSDLTLHLSLVFPDCEMMRCFLDGLLRTGFCKDCLQCCGTSVHLCFHRGPARRISCFRRIVRSCAQLQNRFSCWLYRTVTGMFCLTLDRLVYLYFLLPTAFRRLLRIRRYRGHSYRHCGRQAS